MQQLEILILCRPNNAVPIKFYATSKQINVNFYLNNGFSDTETNCRNNNINTTDMIL